MSSFNEDGQDKSVPCVLMAFQKQGVCNSELKSAHKGNFDEADLCK